MSSEQRIFDVHHVFTPKKIFVREVVSGQHSKISNDKKILRGCAGLTTDQKNNFTREAFRAYQFKISTDQKIFVVRG